jgi:hypothetical protein
MTYRKNDTVTVAAAKASLSRATGYRIEANPTLSIIYALAKRVK